MKRSIITDEFTQDLAEAIRFAKEYHLEGLELRTIEDQPLEFFQEDRIREFQEQIVKEGLVVSSLAGSIGKCRFSERDHEKSKIEKLIRAAGILETSYIRGFGFFSEKTLNG